MQVDHTNSGGRRRPGQRAGLRAEAAIAAARALCEREGLAAVTMRRLADELGVAPNALYSHFRDKAALLDALLDDVIGEIEPPDPTSVDWRRGLVSLLDDTRLLLLDQAELIPLFLSRPTRGPNALRLGEITLALLARGGIVGEPAARALRVLLIYAMGFAAFEAPRRVEPAAEERRGGSQAAFAAAPNAFPHLARQAPLLARHPTEADFEAGLRWLLAGITGHV